MERHKQPRTSGLYVDEVSCGAEYVEEYVDVSAVAFLSREVLREEQHKVGVIRCN